MIRMTTLMMLSYRNPREDVAVEEEDVGESALRGNVDDIAR